MSLSIVGISLDSTQLRQQSVDGVDTDEVGDVVGLDW